MPPAVVGPNTGKLDAAEALLFAASRAQTVAIIRRPWGGRPLIAPLRGLVARVPGWARGLGEQDVLTLNVLGDAGLFPTSWSAPRRAELGSAPARPGPGPHGVGGQDFHAKVSDAYLKIAEEHPERFAVIDADRPQAEVFESVKEALGRVLKDRDDGDPPAPTGPVGPAG